MVSVVMSVNKDRGRLESTIQSVLNQTFKEFEFIIINDGGGEELQEKLENWKKQDDRIVLLTNRENLGLTKSLNKGLSFSKYNLIARIDEGDTWEDKKLEYQIRQIKKYKEVVLITSSYHDIVIEKGKIKSKKIISIPTKDEDFRRAFICGLNLVIHSGVLFKKKLFYNETLKNVQDFELWLRLSFLGKIIGINEPLVKYFREEDSLSHNSYSSCRQILYHYQIYKNFLRSTKNKEFRNKFIGGINYTIEKEEKLCYKNRMAWSLYNKAIIYNNPFYKILSRILLPKLINVKFERIKNKILLLGSYYDEYVHS